MVPINELSGFTSNHNIATTNPGIIVTPNVIFHPKFFDSLLPKDLKNIILIEDMESSRHSISSGKNSNLY